MWLTVPTLVIGRFVMGFAGGLSNIASPVFISETVPAWMLSLIGTSTTAGACTAILLA